MHLEVAQSPRLAISYWVSGICLAVLMRQRHLNNYVLARRISYADDFTFGQVGNLIVGWMTVWTAGRKARVKIDEEADGKVTGSE